MSKGRLSEMRRGAAAGAVLGGIIAADSRKASRVVVGYAELGRFTPLAKNMIAEARLLHTGEKLLAEHVQRAVAVRTDNTIVLSSKRSPGPIELARTMVWGIGMCARPVNSGKPMLVAVNN